MWHSLQVEPKQEPVNLYSPKNDANSSVSLVPEANDGERMTGNALALQHSLQSTLGSHIVFKNK